MTSTPAPITVTHTPKGGETATWEVTYEDITVGEVMDLERLAGRTLAEVEYNVAVGHRTSLMILWFIYRRRTEPKFTLEDLQKIPWHEVDFKQPKPDDTDGDQGKGPDASDEAGKTPAA